VQVRELERPGGADEHLERRLRLGAYDLVARELGVEQDGARRLAEVAARLLEDRRNALDVAGRGRLGRELQDERLGDVGRRRRVRHDESDDVVDLATAGRAPPAGDRRAEDGLRLRVVLVREEDRATAAVERNRLPPGQRPRDLAHVRLGVVRDGSAAGADDWRAVHVQAHGAHREELEQLAGVVLVRRNRRAALAPGPAVVAVVVEKEQHRPVLGDARDEIGEAPERAVSQQALVVEDEPEGIELARGGRDREVLVPEERQLLEQLEARVHHALEPPVADAQVVDEGRLPEDGDGLRVVDRPRVELAVDPGRAPEVEDLLDVALGRPEAGPAQKVPGEQSLARVVAAG
jgi:hypothetical protein